MNAIPSTVAKHRIASIDWLRGMVMLIMALDHVRDLFHYGHPEPTDLAVTTPALFFTRWITHFCAPTFVFLSGVSAWLAGTRRTPREMSRFLIKRGLWLIFVELVIIDFIVQLDPRYSYVYLQVIWAIGGSMVLLGLLVGLRLPLYAIGVIGGLIFFGHNVFDRVDVGTLGQNYAWKLFVSGTAGNSEVPLGVGRSFAVGYALLPWTGVMLLGYVCGSLYGSGVDAGRRRRTLLYSGVGLIGLFVVFRWFNLYGDPSPWATQRTAVLSVISFLNVTKYPCSLLYLSMTIGVSLIVLACVEGVRGRFASVVIVYGNVPFFYYICHWSLMQVYHIPLFFALGHGAAEIPNKEFFFSPPGFGFSLWGVYVIWLAVVVPLYWLCKWFGQYKKTHTQWWLSYV